MVASVDDTVEIGTLLLDGLDGAPEDPLSAAAVVGVGVEEADRLLSAPTPVEYAPDDLQEEQDGQVPEDVGK